VGRSFAVLAAVALALVVAGMAGADGAPLSGSVGPGYAISLKDAEGSAITHLDAGPVTLTVDDKSDEHNFHLRGPGVDVTTGIDEIGSQTFALSLVDGTYTFVCDAHPTRMKGSFTVGTVPPEAPPATPPKPPAPPQLLLTVTSKAITLVKAGTVVTSLAAGSYVIVVHDRSNKQSARLAGAGVNRSTGTAFVGTATWKVTFTVGKLAYRSDAKTPKLRGGQVNVR
jgi:hypothetical protein